VPTAALGIAAVFISQIDLDELQGLPLCFRGLVVVGMAMLLISSVAYFLYSQELNKARIKVGRRGTASAETICLDWPQSAAGYTEWLWLYISARSASSAVSSASGSWSAGCSSADPSGGSPLEVAKHAVTTPAGHELRHPIVATWKTSASATGAPSPSGIPRTARV
jgi:hypothetical protein